MQVASALVRTILAATLTGLGFLFAIGQGAKGVREIGARSGRYPFQGMELAIFMQYVAYIRKCCPEITAYII